MYQIHTIQDLYQMQMLSLNSKIIMTKQRIKAWYDHWDGQVYVAYSGGKDSTVLLHIVREMYPEIPAVFCDTGLEYPSVRSQVKNTENLIIHKPKKHIIDTIKRFGYPIISKEQAQYIYEYRTTKSQKLKNKRWNDPKGKISEVYKPLVDAPFLIGSNCCNIMKKNPSKNFEKKSSLHPIVGIMASESNSRTTNWLKNGCNAFDLKRPISQPLAFWTEQDIYSYIYLKKLKIADIYGDLFVNFKKADYTEDLGHFEEFDKKRPYFETSGIERTGCFVCGFGIQKHNTRFLEDNKINNVVLRGGQWSNQGLWIPGNGGLGYWFIFEWLNTHIKNMDIKYCNSDKYKDLYGDELTKQHLIRKDT